MEAYYPIDLFETLRSPIWQPKLSVIRDNPSAGYIIYKIAYVASSWQELLAVVATETFGDGDITAILYRVASYLTQSHSSQPRN
ncbi:MAG: hypothetical protein R3B45_05270 [Bdellovibrionota bacterium]